MNARALASLRARWLSQGMQLSDMLLLLLLLLLDVSVQGLDIPTVNELLLTCTVNITSIISVQRMLVISLAAGHGGRGGRSRGMGWVWTLAAAVSDSCCC